MKGVVSFAGAPSPLEQRLRARDCSYCSSNCRVRVCAFDREWQFLKRNASKTRNMLRRSAPSLGLANGKIAEICAKRKADLIAAGTYKRERELHSPQSAHIRAVMPTAASREPVACLNFCANNYLGMSNDADVRAAAKAAIDVDGFGMSSVRFICGTNEKHRSFERLVSTFLGTQDTIMYPSNFDANAGVFEALLNEEDAVFSDSLNHASIIDGIRLCKAARFRYEHLDMKDLDAQLSTDAARKARVRMIITDGVFSMDGDIAPLPRIVELAEKHDACIFVDDAHASGVIGPSGRGSAHLHGVADKIAITNSTMGKALGGASGGFSSGLADLIDIQRQAGRPYLFSNAVAPCVVAGSRVVLEKLVKAAAASASTPAGSDDPFQRLQRNTHVFRTEMAKAGLRVLGDAQCPICPVWVGDAKVAAEVADKMFKQYAIYVIAFSFPVVPRDKARIRVQLSAAHSEADVLRAVEAFKNCMPKP
jgi:glycine C-acetyltransferase